MKKKTKKALWTAIALLAAFAFWTLIICFVDVQPIGPQGSSVGLATLNRWVHNITGTHMWLYTVTDWLGLVPIFVAALFAVLGLIQWGNRRSLFKVDRSIIALGGFYTVVMSAYLLFEFVAVNYRPVLIEGCLEASYPSSTTMLVMCVMPTAAMQLWERIKSKRLKQTATVAIYVFTAFMVTGRLVSGVHWITDIIGGALLSAGLVMGYYRLSRK